MKSQPRAEIRIDSLPGGRWTWRYVEPDDDLELSSNETYHSREAAAEVARRAYPGVSFADDQD